MLTMYGISNCGSIKKARAWLDERGVAFAFHDYKKAGVERATLERWADAVGWEVLLNRQGTTFRALDEADKVNVDRQKAIDLMLAQPPLIKRPVIENERVLLVGFKPDVYVGAFASRAA